MYVNKVPFTRSPPQDSMAKLPLILIILHCTLQICLLFASVPSVGFVINSVHKILGLVDMQEDFNFALIKFNCIY